MILVFILQWKGSHQMVLSVPWTARMCACTHVLFAPSMTDFGKITLAAVGRTGWRKDKLPVRRPPGGYCSGAERGQWEETAQRPMWATSQLPQEHMLHSCLTVWASLPVKGVRVFRVKSVSRSGERKVKGGPVITLLGQKAKKCSKNDGGGALKWSRSQGRTIWRSK